LASTSALKLSGDPPKPCEYKKRTSDVPEIYTGANADLFMKSIIEKYSVE
jgi:hypothetical protein